MTALQVAYLDFDRGIPVLGDKGGSVHVRAVVTALARLGHEVTLLCSRVGEGNTPPPARLIELTPEIGPTALAAECGRLGLPVQTLDDLLMRREIGVLAHDRSLLPRALAALAQAGVRPDLIYERHALFHVAGISLAAAFGVPRILEVNAPLAEEQERFRGLALRDLAVKCEAQSWLGADLAVAVSEDVRLHLLAAGVAGERVLVGQNGVDTALFCQASKGASDLRRQWRLGDNPVIGFVGSFKAWHGVDFLIDAFARMHTVQPRLRLLAVGTGPKLAEARERAAALGLGEAAVFTGAVPHAAIPAHLAAMDFTVAPYPAQPGFYFSPLKVVESLAAGRPVVAPRIGQIETLIADGVTGLLYPPDDLDACVAALQRLFVEPGLCGRLGAQGAARARAEWDWTTLVGRILTHATQLTPALERPRLVGPALQETVR
jgi:glycosyltransferase involved in cell wall biosynthesis